MSAWNPHEWNQCPTKDLPERPWPLGPPPSEDKTAVQKVVLACPCRHLDLNVQTCEKCASVVHKLPSLYVCVFCRVQLSATPWTAARQAPLFMEFPRQGCWSGLPFSPPGALPGIPCSSCVCRCTLYQRPPGKPGPWHFVTAAQRNRDSRPP